MNARSKAWARPQTLAEVADVATSPEDFHNHLRDFLHAFKASPALRVFHRARYFLSGKSSVLHHPHHD